jgi:hypothetical protein
MGYYDVVDHWVEIMRHGFILVRLKFLRNTWKWHLVRQVARFDAPEESMSLAGELDCSRAVVRQGNLSEKQSCQHPIGGLPPRREHIKQRRPRARRNSFG